MGDLKLIQTHPQIDQALRWIDKNATAMLNAGKVMYVEAGVHDPRSISQNSKFHAIIGDIHRCAVIKIPGRRIAMSDYSEDECKALLVVWFAKEREQEGRPLKKTLRTVVCPLTGEQITIRPSTADDFLKKDTAEFIEWLYATGSNAGVRWSDAALREYEIYKEIQQ